MSALRLRVVASVRRNRRHPGGYVIAIQTRGTHGAFIIAHATSLKHARRRNRSFGAHNSSGRGRRRKSRASAGLGGVRPLVVSVRPRCCGWRAVCRFFFLFVWGCFSCLLFVFLRPCVAGAVFVRCAVAVRACRRWLSVCVRVACRVPPSFRAVRCGRRRCRCAGVLVCGFRCCRLRCRRRWFCGRALLRVCCRCPCRRGRRCRLASFLLACCRRACFACRGCAGLPSVFGRCLGLVPRRCCLGGEVALCPSASVGGFFLCEEIQTREQF